MTFYIRSGTAFIVSNHTEIVESLPALTFTVMADPKGNLYLEETSLRSDDEVREIYGDVMVRIDRVMRTFTERPSSTGVLLSGSKGSGKTLFARILAKRCMAEGMPVIVINKPHDPDELSVLLNSIKQPYMLMIDEFEKLFSRENQINMLSVFDGMVNGKRLQVITCNSISGIIEYMVNRPGRFYYHFRYKGLDEPFIREYCDKNLKHGTTDEIVNLSKAFDDFNFDVLQSLIEEMNRYREPATEVARYLNVEAGGGHASFRVVEMFIKDEAARTKWVHPCDPNHSDPFNEIIGLYVNDKEWDDSKMYTLSPKDIVAFKQGRITYDNDEIRVVLQKKKADYFNVLDFLV